MICKPETNKSRAIGLLLPLFLLVGAAFTPAQEERGSPLHDDGSVILGITQPWQEVVLGSLKAGRIARICVTEGQVVEEGQMLASLDDGTQRARVEMASTLADSTVEIELAKVKLKAAQHTLDRLTRLNQHAPEQEVDEARTEVESARLEIKMAELKHLQAIQSADLEELFLAQLEVRAPFTGIVTERLRRVGETVDEREGLVSMVELDPMAVLLNCPLRLASGLRKGDRLTVRPVDEQWSPKQGEVVYLSRVADAASQTFLLKLRVTNQETPWVSGLKVRVDLGKAVAKGKQTKIPDVRKSDG